MGEFTHAMRNPIRERDDRIAALEEYVARLKEREADLVKQNVALMGALGQRQEELERLTSDPLPAAAWVREVERAAFARGADAMRQAAARECWMVSDELADIPDMMSEQGAAQNCATRIRALPIPEDKA